MSKELEKKLEIANSIIKEVVRWISDEDAVLDMWSLIVIDEYGEIDNISKDITKEQYDYIKELKENE